jgi:hypothetical protein
VMRHATAKASDEIIYGYDYVRSLGGR